LLAVATPTIGVLLGSIVEVDDSKALRTTVVHWGLTLADPMVVESLRNSLAMAVAVVAPAAFVGVGLARIVRGMPGRSGTLAMTLIRLSTGCPPFLAAIGWLAIASGVAGMTGIEADDRGRWL